MMSPASKGESVGTAIFILRGSVVVVAMAIYLDKPFRFSFSIALSIP
jgi:hypothetical protein